MSADNGTYICYQAKKFTPAVMEIIGLANGIIAEYEQQGYSLTLRQTYYQFVARGWLENKQSNYDRLGRILSDARMAGLVSWTALEDRGRNLMGLDHFDSPAQAFEKAKKEYRLDLWQNQPWRPEVWVEKQAMEGVIGRICNNLRVDFLATKGYNSMSEQWRAGRRMLDYVAHGQRPIVFHLADHDPSGIDMTKDIRERLELFCGVPVIVQRLALNMTQVNEFNPPPNPAKETDSRFASYSAAYGESSWELDALEPSVISGLIESAVLKIRDETLWTAALEQETDDLRVMEEIIDSLGGS